MSQESPHVRHRPSNTRTAAPAKVPDVPEHHPDSDMQSQPATSRNKMIGSYEVLKTIGEGSFAKVKLAIHKPTRMKVAIKMIDKSTITDSYASKHIYREANIMRLFDHPNLVQLFEVMETKTHLHMVLEYAPGGDLLDYIVTKGSVKEDEARGLATQIASGLAHIHSKNVAHRDLKAENILLDEKGNIKITDFGLSNVHKPGETLSTFCGSPVYSAPEIIEGRKYNGSEIDAWSFGVNLYAIVVGDLPFADSNITALYESIAKCRFNMPDFLSAECRNLIGRLLVQDPKRRLTMAQVCDHVWLNDGIAFFEPEEQQTVHLRPTCEDEIDQELLNKMELELGFPRKQAVQSILQANFDRAAGTYNILVYQKKNNIVVADDPKKEEEKKTAKTPQTSDALAQVLFQVEREGNAHGNPDKTALAALKQKLKAHGAGGPNQSPVIKAKNDAAPETRKGVVTLPQIAARNAAKAHQVSPPTDDTPTQMAPEESRSHFKTLSIPLDESLYLPIEQDTPMETRAAIVPRTIKFASNCTAITYMAPELYFQKVKQALEKNEVDWAVDGYLFLGDWGDIRFELEICKLPKMMSFGLRFKKLSGDMWEFKRFSGKIQSQIESQA